MYIKGKQTLCYPSYYYWVFNLGAFNYSFVLLKASDLGVRKDFIPIVFALINVTHTSIDRESIAERC